MTGDAGAPFLLNFVCEVSITSTVAFVSTEHSCARGAKATRFIAGKFDSKGGVRWMFRGKGRAEERASSRLLGSITNLETWTGKHRTSNRYI